MESIMEKAFADPFCKRGCGVCRILHRYAGWEFEKEGGILSFRSYCRRIHGGDEAAQKDYYRYANRCIYL